jgi:hypothetical protein
LYPGEEGPADYAAELRGHFEASEDALIKGSNYSFISSILFQLILLVGGWDTCFDIYHSVERLFIAFVMCNNLLYADSIHY